jgi:hypothetical protein
MPSHVAFSDDSKHEQGRFSSLSLVSLEMTMGKTLRSELAKLLTVSGFGSEFKWAEFSDARHRFAADKMLNFTLGNMQHLSVDVIIWDNHDSRNAVTGRDDVENLVRMYYHLVATTLSKRWPVGSAMWRWLPDEQSSVDWSKLQGYIRAKKHPQIADLFGQSPEFEKVNVSVTPAKSNRHVFIQLADLFAGLGAYSWGNFDKFQLWKSQQKGSGLFS